MKVKNAFHRPISKLNTAEESIRDLENSSTDTTQTETEREKRVK